MPVRTLAMGNDRAIKSQKLSIENFMKKILFANLGSRGGRIPQGHCCSLSTRDWRVVGSFWLFGMRSGQNGRTLRLPNES